MALTLYRQTTPNQVSPSGGLTLYKQPQKPISQVTKPSSPTVGNTTIGDKSYPNQSLVGNPASPYKLPAKPTNIFESAKSVFTNIKNAVTKISKEYKTDVAKEYKPKNEALGAPIGRLLQKTPNLDLGTKGQKIFQATDTETKIVNFISNFPSAIAQSWGKSLETLATKEGKQKLKTDAKNLPKTISEVKTYIDNNEWQKAFDAVLSNSAISVGLDVADFIPIGAILTKGAKAGINSGLRKEAQMIVEEAIEETEKTAIKTTVKAGEPGTKIIDNTTSVSDAITNVGAKPEPIKPIGEGEAKVSKLGLRVEQTAIEKKLTEELGDLPDYKQMDMKEQAKMSSDLLNSDPERALRIALGEEDAPKGLQAQSVFKALEGSLTTPEVARKLATSPLVSEASALGQKIKALDVQISDSPVAAMKQVIEARAKGIESKLGKNINKARENVVKDIQKKVRTPDKYDWNKFLEEIKC